MLKRIVVVLFAGLAVQVAAAQPGTCPGLVDQALAAIDENCSGMERNNACYGYNRVDATFTEEVPPDFFAAPADRTGLTNLETIATSSMSVEDDRWGVAVLNAQANVPNTIPGQAVTFVLLGDVEVENAVAPEDAFSPADPIPAIAAVPANLRSGPGLDHNVVGGAPAGAELPVDGLSPDGEWLRTAHRNRPAWISRSVVEADEAFDDLPAIESTQQTPMQAFYLRTGLGNPVCEQAPDDVLMLQGPENLEVELTVNGADIRMGSTVLLRILPPGDRMEIIVLDGHVVIPGQTTIYEGYRSVVCLDEPQNRGLDGQSNDRVVSCGWSQPEPVEQDEITGNWCVLEDVPEGILNYPVDLLCSEEEIQQAVTQQQQPPSAVDCSNFAHLSPTGAIPTGPATFYWSEVPGADRYEVVFYNYLGERAANFFTSNSSLSVNTGTIATGGQMRWEVIAWQGSEPACSTGQTQPTIRQPPTPTPTPTPRPQPSGPSASWACTGVYPGEISVNWSGWNSDTALDIQVSSTYNDTFPVSPISPSGSYVVYACGEATGSVSGQQSGTNVSLPPIDCGCGG